MKLVKPLGKKSYGSIPHLPSSRLGEGDHHCSEGQARIATEKKRDKNDFVVVQEKLDGGNVGVALLNGEIIAITRGGIFAKDSRFEQHHKFDQFVRENEERFRKVINEGERICGEWLYHQCGTKYDLPHEPFVVFDIFTTENKRVNFQTFNERVGDYFVKPFVISTGDPVSVEEALGVLGEYGQHGATEQVEGAVWRVERNGEVDFLCKFVRHDKVDGKYMKEEICNNWTGDFK